MKITSHTLHFVALLAVAATAQIQLPSGVNLPPPDEDGWIKIFRGAQDSGNFYVTTRTDRFVPSQNKHPFPNDDHFTISGDTIIVAGQGKSNAHFIFKQEFSHHRVRFQMRWPGSIGNAGILMKVQEHDTTQSQGFPRSIECQGDPQQGLGQIWAIGSIREGNNMVNGGTWVTLRASTMQHPAGWCGTGQMAARYDSTQQEEIHWGGVGDPCGNLIVGGPGWQHPRPASLHTGTNWRSNTDWVTVEVDTRGHDTTIHYVDGEVVMKYHSPRIASRDDHTAIQKMLTSGLMAWQSEGSNLWYRNIEVKLHPEDPLYGELYPTSLRPTRSTAAPTERPRLVVERGFPTMITRDGKRISLTGRQLPDAR